MAVMVGGSVNRICEFVLTEGAKEIETEFAADLLTFYGQIDYGVDDVIRSVIEPRKPKKDKLVMIVDTPGGYIEVVQRIVNTIRHFYQSVEFIVPNSAMSAGTVLVLSGDAIHMDYYSVLGPIDPQIRRGDQFVPALGYLMAFNKLMKASKTRKLTPAEIAYLIGRFDPGELYRYGQARELSVALLREWLVKYKFKDWTKTQSKGRVVTPKMRERRAEEIARKLNNTEHWLSHGRGIGMAVLSEDLKILIEDFGKVTGRKDKISRYFDVFVDHTRRQGYSGVVHIPGRYMPFRRAS